MRFAWLIDPAGARRVRDERRARRAHAGGERQPPAAEEARARASDVDGDGLGDREDKCPHDAETPNGYMDDDGCPDLASSSVASTTGTPEIMEKIIFADGRSEIRPVRFRCSTRSRWC